jgi:small subunit ribosomal protein S13
VARIAGVDLPKEKRIEVGMTYIYGIGVTMSRRILAEAKVSPDTRVKNLTEDEVHRLQNILAKTTKVEGDLRREIAQNIKRLVDVGSYRGTRHRKGLPVRGQRTKTNARTRKGPRKTIAVRKGEQV